MGIVNFGLGGFAAPPPPAGDTLLDSIVAYLKATSAVTDLLSDPDAISFDRSDWGTQMPFVLIEAYHETLPGDTADDEPVSMRLCAYADTIPLVSQLIHTLNVALDTPNINPLSTRTAQFTWTGGATTGVMRDATEIHRDPMLWRDGTYIYRATSEYQFWVTPSQ